MAIKWSWAFGAESGATLQTMGWSVEDTDPVYARSDTTYTYTYTGSPTRYSLNLRDSFSQVKVPIGCTPPEGWVAVPIYVSGSYHTGENAISVVGASSGRYISIQVKNGGTGTFALFVDNTEKATFSMSANDWQYLALQYSMTGSTWSGRAYLNGVAVTSEFTGVRSAETAARAELHGVGDGGLKTWIGQIVTFDSKADSGETPRYCTRIEPTTDTGTVGVWTPNVGTDDFAVLSGSFNAATFTENSSSTIGDNCRVQAQNLATQLGVTPTSITGITVHAWATGSGQNGFTAISDNDSSYDNGTAITPDTNDPTYAFATAADQPSNSAVWNATSSVYFKYEVS